MCFCVGSPGDGAGEGGCTFFLVLGRVVYWFFVDPPVVFNGWVRRFSFLLFLVWCLGGKAWV